MEIEVEIEILEMEIEIAKIKFANCRIISLPCRAILHIFARFWAKNFLQIDCGQQQRQKARQRTVNTL